MKQFSAKTIMLLAGLAVLSLKSRSQDIVINNKHDTIRCKLSHSMMGAYKYKDDKGETVKLEMGDVREYYTENKKTWVRRVYITSSRVPVFVDVVTTGKLNLYEMSYKNQYYDGSLTWSSIPSSMGGNQHNSKTQYYVAKSDTAEVVWDDDLSRSKSKDLMDAKFVPFIKDNTTVYGLYQAENRVNAAELKKLVDTYNGSK